MQPIKYIITVFAALSTLAALTAGTQSDASPKPRFFLHGGDTVVFMGDSITALHRATWPRGDISPNYTYCMDIVSWVAAHAPSGADGSIKFYDLGVGGDTTQGDQWPNGGPAKNQFVPPSTSYSGSHTIDSDLAYVEALDPTVVTLDFGMNDGEYVDCDPSDPTYNSALCHDFTSGMTHIVSSLLSWSRSHKTRLRIVVLTPSYFDNAKRVSAGWSFGWGAPVASYNQTLQSFGRWEASYVSRLKNPGVTCIDLNGPMAFATGNLPAGQSLTQEGIHPTEQGYEVMAAAILNAWGGGSIQSADLAPSRDPTVSQAVWNAFNYGQQTLVPQAGGGSAKSIGWTGPAITASMFKSQTNRSAATSR